MPDQRDPPGVLIQFEPAAEDDLGAARDWYFENAGPFVVRKFDEALVNLLELLREFPESAPISLDDRLRSRPMGSFPYTLYYELVEARLIVHALKHQRRKPWSFLREDPVH